MPATAAPWTVSGKAALSTAEGTETINLVWHRENQQQDRVQLSGPMGLGALELTRNEYRVTWLDDGTPRPLASLPLTSTARRVVAELPLEQLGNWLMGYPPKTGTWSVKVTQWQSSADWRVPRKILIEHPQFKIRMALIDWELNHTP